MINLTLDIEPVAKERPRVTRHGTYTPAKTRKFEAECKKLIRSMIGPTTPRQGPLSLRARFVVSKPKRPKHPTEPIVRPDLDNYLKALKDVGNELLWYDDSQLVEIYARKLYDVSGGKPRIEIQLEDVHD